MTLIYSDKYLEVFYVPELNSDTLVATFNNKAILADGKSFWGQSPIKKNNWSGLGIMSKKADWFPVISEELRIKLLDIFSNYKNVVGYGFSMGAYGALKYSKLLRFTHTIAFSPQVDIDPNKVAKEDNRYRGHFKDAFSDSHGIVKSDIGGYCVAIYDSKFNLDTLHAIRLSSYGVDLVKSDYTEHATVQCIDSSVSFSQIINLLLETKLTGLYKKIKLLKKLHWNYFYTLGCRLAEKKHSLAAINVLEKSLKLGGDKEKIYIELSKLHEFNYQDSLDYAVKACIYSISGKAFNYLVGLHVKNKDYELALRVYFVAYAQIGHYIYLRNAVLLLEKLGRLQEASDLLVRLEALKLDSFVDYNALRARVSFGMSNFNDAVKYSKLAVKLNPDNEYLKKQDEKYKLALYSKGKQ
ncbi:MAG: hypothetical protein JXK16_03335 [Thiotrichales bacterium]|nr:hypothetical protein [Thiotrichales bacterium]